MYIKPPIFGFGEILNDRKQYLRDERLSAYKKSNS